jgi:hypothetical protein
MRPAACAHAGPLPAAWVDLVLLRKADLSLNPDLGDAAAPWPWLQHFCTLEGEGAAGAGA